jgi:uncharacterized protein (TIGR02217 family)
MPITVYPDVILPDSIILAGVRGRNERMNQRATNQGGFTSANVIWTRTLRRYEVGIAPLTVAQWAALEGIHEVTEGGAFGFLMRDPKDQTAAAGLLHSFTTAEVGTIGQGFGVPVFRMFKRYTAGSRTKDRRITRPGSVVIRRAGVVAVAGSSAGQYALNATTGTVTFVADASQAMSSITVGASTVLNFANGTGMVAAMAVGERVFLTGVSGTAAANLNNLSHAITANGATSLTISTTTTGLTATSGTALRYPQASDTMTWTGDFYVPVHFEQDFIDWEISRSGSAETRLTSGPNVTIVEVRE